MWKNARHIYPLASVSTRITDICSAQTIDEPHLDKDWFFFPDVVMPTDFIKTIMTLRKSYLKLPVCRMIKIQNTSNKRSS